MAPASPPRASILAPECHALRPVKRDSIAPTLNSAIAVTPIAKGSARGPGASMNGARGNSAPAPNERNDEIAAPHGDPSSSGFKPSSSDRKSSARGPGASMNGARGNSAPAPNERNDEIAAPHGDPSSSGFKPSS